MQKTRAEDEALEQETRTILEKIYAVNGLAPIYGNAKDDINGCDVRLSSRTGDIMLVDEKMFASHNDAYSQKKTFSFEAETNNKKGEPMTGWLFNKNLKTTHYALIYPKMENNTLVKAEILIVDKNAILEKINDAGFYNKQDVLNYLEEYGHLNTNSGLITAKVNDLISVCHSTRLREDSKNILIDRAWLRAKAVKVIDVQDVSKVERQYAELIKHTTANKENAAEHIKTGILFNQQAKNAYQKASRIIPKLKGQQLPDFIDTTDFHFDIGKKINLRVMSYASIGNTVILQAMANKEIYDKPIALCCGPLSKDTDLNKLSYKDIPLKKQFHLFGEIHQVKDKKIVRNNQQELAANKDEAR